jgi:hypothetical protein
VLTVRTLEGLAGLLALGLDVHLRYSAGPAADRDATSRDYESGLELPGLATVDLQPPDWWTRPAADWLARQICKYGHLAEQDPERHPWLLTGRVVGRGPDNEPLLAEPEQLARLAPSLLDEAVKRYHAGFEVGRAN